MLVVSLSIFSPSREKELKKVIDQLNGPIILAWGVDSIIKNLAEQAYRFLPKEKIVGMEHDKSPYYYHVSPPPLIGKLRWLKYMNDRIS